MIEDTFTSENLILVDAVCLTREHETLERSIFGLTLAIATEPSKLGQLREMLAHLQATDTISTEFLAWTTRQIDDKLVSMALEYASDAEILVQILSFKCSTFTMLIHNIEDLHRQEKICPRVYVRAKLLLMDYQ
jgi:hypothetical protein